jgi:hypothetical protein
MYLYTFFFTKLFLDSIILIKRIFVGKLKQRKFFIEVQNVTQRTT